MAGDVWGEICVDDFATFSSFGLEASDSDVMGLSGCYHLEICRRASNDHKTDFYDQGMYQAMLEFLS